MLLYLQTTSFVVTLCMPNEVLSGVRYFVIFPRRICSACILPMNGEALTQFNLSYEGWGICVQFPMHCEERKRSIVRCSIPSVKKKPILCWHSDAFNTVRTFKKKKTAISVACRGCASLRIFSCVLKLSVHKKRRSLFFCLQ